METDAGTIELELFEADAPNTVANFTKLAKEGFYDGLAFHRVIPGFSCWAQARTWQQPIAPPASRPCI